MEKIGFIGLGNMGKGMCRNIIAGGYDTTVFDAKKAAMQPFSGSARLALDVLDVLHNSTCIFLSLPNSIVVESIIDDFLKENIQGKIIVDTSTSYPVSSRKLAKKLREAGCGFVDAPLLAGPQEAETGELLALVAGEQEDVERVRDMIKTYCREVTYVGETGNGHLVKIASNFVSLTQTLIYAQVYPIIAKYGVSEKLLYDSLNNEIFSNWIFQFYSEKFVNKNYRLDFAMALGLKDLQYMKKLCEELNIPGFLLDGAIALCNETMKEQKEGEVLDFSHASRMVSDMIEK